MRGFKVLLDILFIDGNLSEFLMRMGGRPQVSGSSVETIDHRLPGTYLHRCDFCRIDFCQECAQN